MDRARLLRLLEQVFGVFYYGSCEAAVTTGTRFG